MDHLTFISQIVAAVAWPITAVVCVVLLRKVAGDLVPLLRTLKYSELELHFGREIAELKQTADATLPEETRTKEQREAGDALIRLASVRPRSAIRDAWRRVETALVKLATSHNLAVASGVWAMPMVLASLMLNSGIITDAQYDLVSRLRQLLNEAERAAVDSLALEEAQAAVQLALRIEASLTH